MLTPSTLSRRLLFVLAGALILLAAWPANGIAPLLFIGFVPMLLIEDFILKEKRSGKKIRLFGYAYLFFSLFNLWNTWWIWNASAFGMCGAVFTNALLMTGIFHLFHRVRLRTRSDWSYVALVAMWLSFEHLHMDWDLNWPWLNLGNGFAAWAKMIQWYEFTGTQGGTIWVWVVNILITKAILLEPKRKTYLTRAALIVAIPVALSLLRYYTYTEEVHPVEAVVVQPNIDPYNEKFSGMSSREQLIKALQLATPMLTDKTRLVVAPETALPDPMWEDGIREQPDVQVIQSYVRAHSNVSYLTGLTTYKLYKKGEPLSETARKFHTAEKYFDAYNAAMMITPADSITLYHKSRLVPGVEKMPFPKFFGLFGDFAIDLGGTTGSLGVQKEPTIFKADSIAAAPAICYESIYGDFLSGFIRKGANVICIITNDGWWGDTPGYRQHCQYARLRAIEFRRPVIRSANTGTSCFVNQRGDISQATDWWVPAAIRGTVNTNSELTVYAMYGDYLGRIALLVAAFFIALTITSRRKKI